ncbi:FTR1 family protein [Yeosuana sp.]|uniref:FTR1 family protein n=1 Tax=Yeosuana sp. TaxID=2529388 RepID=UPI004054D023
MLQHKRYLYNFTVGLIALLSYSNIYATTIQDESNIQTIIHLLDYLSKDYPAAVKNGAIIDEGEYLEMKEFSETILSLSKKLELTKKQANQIQRDLMDLRANVLNKVSHQKIKAVTSKVKWAIINFTEFEISPPNWPNIDNGQKLFLNNCIQCHGVSGNGQGKLAMGLNPAPTNFLIDTLMREVSPFQAYNTIKLGVEGTAMQSFGMLSDKEVWDLSFYIKSLRFNASSADSLKLKEIFNKVSNEVSLKDVATLSDKELIQKLGYEDSVTYKKLKALRIFSLHETSTENSLVVARNYLNAVLLDYKGGNKKSARQNALNAYLEGIEPVEVRLKANDPEFTSQLEQQMMAVRQAIENGKSNSTVQAEIAEALSMIDRADQLMRERKQNYWLTFFLAASIMLREGLEAFLIIALILALIKTSGTKKALPYVHGGWIMAILTGIAGWFLSDWIIGISGKNREIMEGLISLVAVIVLAFVGFWLHNHSHSKKWKDFIEKKIGKQLRGEKMLGLAVFSFMVVFREAFESILFLQAISLDTKTGDGSSIGLGVIAAFALIVLLVVIFLKYSKRIPVRQLFRYSAWVITLLAVILIGKGIHAIQEAGWLSVTGFPIYLKIDWLGVYPTSETLIAQMALFTVLMVLYYLSNSRNRGIKIK